MTSEAFVARHITEKLVDYLLRKQCVLSVNDGEEWVVKQSTDERAILGSLYSTGEDHIRVYDKAGNKLGTLWLIYCNGMDVISDYSTSLETLLEPVNAYCSLLTDSNMDCPIPDRID